MILKYQNLDIETLLTEILILKYWYWRLFTGKFEWDFGWNINLMWKEEIQTQLFIGFIIPVCLTSYWTWKCIQRGSKQIAISNLNISPPKNSFLQEWRQSCKSWSHSDCWFFWLMNSSPLGHVARAQAGIALLWGKPCCPGEFSGWSSPLLAALDTFGSLDACTLTANRLLALK